MSVEYQQELMRKWESVIAKSDHIFTWTGRGELAYLCEMASRVSQAVEMGVYMGRGSRVMLDANPNLHLWSVDPFMVDGTDVVTKYFLDDHIASGRCDVLRQFTPEAVKTLAHMSGKIEFIYIDAAHDFDNVLQDIRMWKPLMKTGAVMCGHDFDPGNDVWRAVHAAVGKDWFEPVPRIWAHLVDSK